jgi:hypothetical protein
MNLQRKRVFRAVNASLSWQNKVSDVRLIQVFWLLIGQQGFVDFFWYRPLLPIGWRIVQIYAHAGGKRPIQRQPILVQYKQHQQANPLLSMDNYTPLVISRSDKNKQLT